MEKIRFGIAGCGVIGPWHADAISNLEDAELVAVSDAVEEKARTMGEKYGVDSYTDYRQMVSRDDIDVINICVPSGLHAEIGVEAARAGKHIVVEKPLEVTLEKADRLIEACNSNKVKLAVIFQSRFGDDVQKIHRAITEDKLGKLVLGDAYLKWYRTQEYYDSGAWRGTWKLDGGGALMNQAIHPIDLLQWMMGPVDTIYAYSGLLAHERMEVEDTAVAILKFKNGALGVIEGTTAAYPGFPVRLEFYGQKGSVVLEDGRITAWELIKETEEDKRMKEGIRKRKEITAKGASDPTVGITCEGHRRQIVDMMKAIRKDRKPLVDGEEGRKSVEIILSIYESARTGKPVKLS